MDPDYNSQPEAETPPPDGGSSFDDFDTFQPQTDRAAEGVPPDEGGDSDSEPEDENGTSKALLTLAVILAVLALLIGGFLVGKALFGADTPTPTPTESGEAFISISEPIAGAVVDVPNAVPVKGMAGSLFEGNLVVQARDQAGNILAEQATTVQAPDAGTGGQGPWAVEMVVPVKPGTPGSFYAFSSSPQDGSVVASASVDVVFGTEVASESFIIINQPVDGEQIDIFQAVNVKGEGGGLFEGNVVVQALDDNGNVLAEQPTIVQSPDGGIGGSGTWEVQLSIDTTAGSSGQIRAFSPSPADGSDLAADSVVVKYGQADQAQLEIAVPADGNLVNTTNPIPVSGTGSGLFENTIIVRALDQDGNVLAEQVTTLDASETGGSGSWAVELSVSVNPGTVGQIVAASPDPSGSQPAASSKVGVTYGTEIPPEEPILIEDYLWSLASINGSELIPTTLITAEFKDDQIAGTAGCNNYFGEYNRTDTEISFGPFGTTRMACPDPEGVMDQENGYLATLATVTAYVVENDILWFSDANGSAVLAYQGAVVGNVVVAEPAELPEGSVVAVQLQDTSLQDVAATVVGEQIIQGAVSFPIPFDVIYPVSVIEENHTYSLSVRITDADGNLIFINTSSHQVITNGQPSVIDVTVDPV